MDEKIRYPHQAWCLAILKAFDPNLKTLRTHKLEGSVAITKGAGPALWGPLALYVSNRMVVLEHSSDSLSFRDFAGFRIRIARASSRYIRAGQEGLHPALVVFCHRYPSALLKLKEVFEPFGPWGIWRFGPLEMGPIILISTSTLKDTHRNRWLKHMARIPSNGEDFMDFVELILSENALSLEAKGVLMEEIMSIGRQEGRISDERMEAFGRKVDEWIQRETEAIRREERLKFDSETRELIRALQAENAALRAENAELKAEIAELKAEIAELKAENAELRARLGE